MGRSGPRRIRPIVVRCLSGQIGAQSSGERLRACLDTVVPLGGSQHVWETKKVGEKKCGAVARCRMHAKSREVEICLANAARRGGGLRRLLPETTAPTRRLETVKCNIRGMQRPEGAAKTLRTRVTSTARTIRQICQATQENCGDPLQNGDYSPIFAPKELSTSTRRAYLAPFLPCELENPP